MNVQIVGTMLDPSGGEPAGGAMIQFIALAPYAGVAKGAQSIQTTSATGEYDFPLNYGRYAVAINHSGRFVNQAVSVSVNEESPATMDLDTLFESTVPLTPPEFAYLEELLAKAEQAVVDAEGFAGDAANQVSLAEGEVVKATNQANIATIEADRAKTEADRAAEVTGLDTVEQAVDMALGELAGLMTESEARAINRINEAKYDASGFVNSGKYGANNINEGLYVDGVTPDTLFLGGGSSGSSETDYAVFHIASAVMNAIHNNNQFKFEFSPAEDGKRTYNKTTGESIVHPDVATAFALAASDVNIEVVTHRVDLPAVEYYEEELTGVQEVMDNIQSTSTTFGNTDVPTVLSTRKLSYFQQYDGQFPEVTADPDFINDRYRCVVWPNLTDEQKRKVAAYMGEKLFVGVNGNIINGRLGATTIRGLGNGDWHNIESTKGNLEFKSGIPVLSRNGNPYVQDKNNKGVFTDENGCHLYVVATVPRANKGIYAEGLNEYGTAKCSDDKFWYESANKPTTLAECFTGQVGGDIASGKSGHPDGIFYDGIEAGGLNGVIDWRLGAVANDSPEEAAKVEAKVENGTYRGLEKLVRTVVEKNDSTYTLTKSATATTYKQQSIVFNCGLGTTTATYNDDYKYVILKGDNGNVRVVERDLNGADDGMSTHDAAVPYTDGYVYLTNNVNNDDLISSFNTEFPNGTTIDFYYVTESELNLSVSGEFNTQMVIGDPANILLTDALKDGWLGTWCNVIPDGTQLWFPYSRKFVGDTSSSSARRTYTVDGGVTWIEGGLTFDSTLNAYRSAADANYVGLHSYRAFANQTKPSENKRVYNGKAGLMSVFSTMANQQSTLSETLIGKVLKSSGVNLPYGATNSLTDFTIIDAGYASNESLWGKLGEIAGQFPNHTKLRLGAPINDSPAIKVLPYQISNNGKGSIGYQANELTWDATKATPDDATAADPSSFTAWVVGETYKITGGQFSGKVLQCVGSLSVVLDGYIFEGKDGLYLGSTGALRFKPYTLTTGWGDDDTIKVTAEGSDTFVDTNGIINESVVHELAIEYTWTSNHARAGTQVPGVDL
ncbi:hypothetical protein VPH1208_0019 [Vibrio phage 1208]